jgi:hypothetical protein
MNDQPMIPMTGDGVVVDISGLSKPERIKPIIRRCAQYIDAMGYAKKHVEVITLSSGDYSSIFKIMADAAKKESRPPVVGLRFREIPVKSANT